MSKLPWFPIYAADTLSDERFQGWDVEERGAWFTLICMCWREGSISSESDVLARALHVDSNRMRLLWSAIGSRFVDHPDFPGRLTSPRLEEEREKAQKISGERSKAGKIGANARWGKRNSAPVLRMAPDDKRIEEPLQSDATAMRLDALTVTLPDITLPDSQTGNRLTDDDHDLETFRTELGTRTKLGRPVGIGKDRDRVLKFFRDQLSRYPYEGFLADCVVQAEKSDNGIPTTLAWYVGWISQLPDLKEPLP